MESGTGLPPAVEADIKAFEADCDQRLAGLRASDTIKGLFINRYLELFRAAAGDAFVARCYEAPGHPRVFDLHTYPYASLTRVARLAAREIAPRHGSAHQWLWAVGREATQGYLHSLLGRAFLSTFNPSPRAMLSGMPWAISTCFTFGTRSVVFTGPNAALFRCRFDFSPAPSNAGAVQAAVEAAGGGNVRVEVSAFDLFNYDLEVSWR